MSTQEFYRFITKAQTSLDAAETLLTAGQEGMAQDYAKHAANSAVVAEQHAEHDTDRFIAEQIQELAEDILLPAYMRKHFTNA